MPLTMSTRLAAQRLASVVILGARIRPAMAPSSAIATASAARRPIGGNGGAVPQPNAEFERHAPMDLRKKRPEAPKSLFSSAQDRLFVFSLRRRSARGGP